MANSSLEKEFSIDTKEEDENLTKMFLESLNKPIVHEEPKYKTLSLNECKDLLHKTKVKELKDE